MVNTVFNDEIIKLFYFILDISDLTCFFWFFQLTPLCIKSIFQDSYHGPKKSRTAMLPGFFYFGDPVGGVFNNQERLRLPIIRSIVLAPLSSTRLWSLSKSSTGKCCIARFGVLTAAFFWALSAVLIFFMIVCRTKSFNNLNKWITSFCYPVTFLVTCLTKITTIYNKCYTVLPTFMLKFLQQYLHKPLYY